MTGLWIAALIATFAIGFGAGGYVAVTLIQRAYDRIFAGQASVDARPGGVHTLPLDGVHTPGVD